VLVNPFTINRGVANGRGGVAQVPRIEEVSFDWVFGVPMGL
jgi:hypothetical protein